MTDEEVDLLITSDQVLVQQPKNLSKQGIFKKVAVQVKVPLDKKLAKDFCNFEVKATVQRGSLNINKKFIKNIAKFVTYMDTLKEIVKRSKKLITKIHYQDELLKDF